MISQKNNMAQKIKIKANDDINYTDYCEIIQRGDVFYSIAQTDNESREIYLNRVNYIVGILDDTNNVDADIDINEVIKSSYIWRNITYYGMSYPSTLLRTLHTTSKK